MNPSEAKRKIENTVAQYKFAYREDYDAVVKAVEAMHHMVIDDFASTKDTPNMRGLYETPEDLFAMFVMELEPKEMDWFKSKEGGRWYAHKFKEFAIPKNITWDR